MSIPDEGVGRIAPAWVLAPVLAVVSTVVWGCTPSSATVAASNGSRGVYRGFSNLEPVTIRGYASSAMEPFITRDRRYLLFNSSNVPPAIPSLRFASRVDGDTFQYRGVITGANQPGALSGTPSMSDDGSLYFISTRSYSTTRSTVYAGQFSSGTVTGVHLVSGIAASAPGTVDFDVEVDQGDNTLYVSVGQFSGGSAPTSSSIEIYRRSGSGFVPDPNSSRVMRAVNVPSALTYGASISSNGLEVFFTRDVPGSAPSIYRAIRTSVGRRFDHVQQVAAITGYAEAPSISADGGTLYFHRKVGDLFQIATVTRH